MDRRPFLHRELTNVLQSNNVYFQPPESIKLSYPAIIYNLNDLQTNHANNKLYGLAKQYVVTYITRDPDDPIVDKLIALEYCRFQRSYRSDGLNHYIFEIFY